jgi:hypothetical protein
MSEPAFEILCPVCRSVVPAEAAGCPNCRGEALAAVEQSAAPPPPPPEVGSMRLKEYHRLVRTNYWAVEGPRATGIAPGGFRLRAYLPFVLLLLGVLVGTIMALGRL